MRSAHHHPDPSRPDPAESRLDRAWAATRPELPQPEELDALWAHASAELDRLALTPAPGFAPARVRRRPWGRVGGGLVAAAALLMAAGLMLRGRSESKAGTIIDVAADQTLVVRIDADGSRVDLQPQVEPLVASTTLAESTAHDVFNALESSATP